MSAAKNGLSFNKINRLLKPSEFQHVFDHIDCKQGGKHCTMLCTSNPLSKPRLGLIVSRRNIRMAVNRNKVKRVVRESFRHLTQDFQALDIQFDTIVIIKASAGQIDASELRKELNQQWSKLIAKRLRLNT